MSAQLDMFAAFEPPPALVPMHFDGWEVAPITERGDATEAKVEAAYSAATLCESGKVRNPFPFRGYTWVNTGGCFYKGNADYEIYRVVPAAEFAGPGKAHTYHDHDFFHVHRPKLGGYHGMQAKHGRNDVVLIGPPMVLVLKAATPCASH